jgi:hypothetical protein
MNALSDILNKENAGWQLLEDQAIRMRADLWVFGFDTAIVRLGSKSYFY